MEFDHADKRPSKAATPGDKRGSEALPIFEGSEVRVRSGICLWDALFHARCFYRVRTTSPISGTPAASISRDPFAIRTRTKMINFPGVKSCGWEIPVASLDLIPVAEGSA